MAPPGQAVPVMVDLETPPCSVVMVEGHPAAAGVTRSGLKYIRAGDAAGASWGPAVTVVSSGIAPDSRVVLQTVNGNPAICYYDPGKINFVRAGDTVGSQWNVPVPAVNFTAQAALGMSMGMVGGNPAIVFSTRLQGVSFVRAQDANGTGWGAPVVLNTQSQSGRPSLKVVDGHPAVAYAVVEANLWYLRALNAAGTEWGQPVNVSAAATSNPQDAVMEIVNGHPAIGFMDGESLKYVRAADPSGTTWGSPVELDTHGAYYYRDFSMTVTGGKPAIGYIGSLANDLKYVRALDSDGATAPAWAPPLNVVGGAGNWSSAQVLDVAGVPALFYHVSPSGTLHYIRATEGTAGERWTPRIEIKKGTPVIPPGGEADFGSVAIGQTGPLTLTLNVLGTASSALAVQDITIDGPDAAEFSVISLPASPLASPGTTTFTVQYAPLSGGIKNATMHLVSNADIHSYDIHLTARSIPEISVSRAGGVVLVEGQAGDFPVIASGTTQDLVFTVQNPGGALLSGLAVTLDGPDSSEFFVAVPPPDTLPPGGTGSFTVRHAPLTSGNKTAALHIASNAAGPLNPFDYTLRLVPGVVDQTFALSSFTGGISDIALQGDGRILLGGSGVTRLHPGGSPDPSFFSPAINGPVRCIAIQKDGKILIGGEFSQVGGQPRGQLVRLLADGSLDPSFVTPIQGGSTPFIGALAIQPDGYILAAGRVNLQNSPVSVYVLRFRPDGSTDSGFSLTNAPSPMWCLALQPGGKFLTGGPFWGGRLRADGTADGLSLALGGSGYLNDFALRPDGSFIAGGNGSFLLARYLPDGTRVSQLSPNTFSAVRDLALQADGFCLVSGRFTQLGTSASQGIARIRVDGSADSVFNPGYVSISPSMESITGMALHADGKILIASPGSFKIGGLAREGAARLHNDPAFSQLKVEGGHTVRWLRGGSAPEVEDVTFDFRPDNAADWNRLGTAARIPAGWELSGLTLPAFGQFRAQAFAGGSVMEEHASILTPLESWRLQHFNTSDSTGDAADDADPDHDGLTNFTEFAFGLNPVDRSSNTPPEFKYANGSFTATFTAAEGREDIHYGAEWSPSMLPGTWAAIPDTGSNASHVFTMPAAAGRMFVRFTVNR